MVLIGVLGFFGKLWLHVHEWVAQHRRGSVD